MEYQFVHIETEDLYEKAAERAKELSKKGWRVVSAFPTGFTNSGGQVFRLTLFLERPKG